MASRSRQRCCTTPRTSHAKTKPSSSHSSGPRRPPSVASTSHSGLRRVSGLVSQTAGRALTSLAWKEGVHSASAVRRRRNGAGAPDQRSNELPQRATSAPNFDHVGDGDDAEPRGTRQQPQRMTGVEHQAERSEQQHLPRAAYLARGGEHPDGKDRPADGEGEKSPVQHVAEDEQRRKDCSQRRASPADRQPVRRHDPEQRDERDREPPGRGGARWPRTSPAARTEGCRASTTVSHRTIRIRQRLAEQADLRQVLRQIRDRRERHDEEGHDHEERRQQEERSRVLPRRAQRVVIDSFEGTLL